MNPYAAPQAPAIEDTEVPARRLHAAEVALRRRAAFAPALCVFCVVALARAEAGLIAPTAGFVAFAVLGVAYRRRARWLLYLEIPLVLVGVAASAQLLPQIVWAILAVHCAPLTVWRAGRALFRPGYVPPPPPAPKDPALGDTRRWLLLGGVLAGVCVLVGLMLAFEG
jgi:hypothetical protein